MADGRDLSQVLLQKARGDLAAIRVLLEGDVGDDVIGFHAQQTVEKALKAVLAARGVAYRFSHDLAYLGDLLESEGVALPSALRGAEALAPWAAEFRYEDPPNDLEPLDRDAAKRLADAAVAWAEQALG